MVVEYTQGWATTWAKSPTIPVQMATKKTNRVFEIACPDCSAMLRIDAETGALISHTPAPRKRTFEDLATAAQAMFRRRPG